MSCSAFAKCPCRLRVPPTDHPRLFMASWYGKEIGPRFSRAHRASTAPPGLRSVVRSFVLNVTSHSLTFFIFVFRVDERPTALGCRAHFCLAQQTSTHSKDYERDTRSSESFLYLSMIRDMLARLETQSASQTTP